MTKIPSKRRSNRSEAWKVAYADFVTAMMALFMVLWLAAQDQKIKEAVERAFRNPFLSVTKESSGILPSPQRDSGRSRGGKFNIGAASSVEVAFLRRLHQELSRSLVNFDRDSSDEERSIQLDLTNEGLRITVFDRSAKPIFLKGSDQFTEYGKWILTTLAWEMSRYKSFAIEIEGHTEAGHSVRNETYGNWELSTDRANAGRRTLLQHGVDAGQIRKVAGYADTIPIAAADPTDPSNRRITLFLRIREKLTSFQ